MKLAKIVSMCCSMSLLVGQGIVEGQELKSAGPMAFNSDGVLFVGDPMAATVHAIEVKSDGDANKAKYNIDAIDQKIAAALGIEASELLINDMAVNPRSGEVYFSVSRGKGPDAIAAVMVLGQDGELDAVDFDELTMTSAELPNAPSSDDVDRRGNSKRMYSITDLSFINNQVVVAGLSNEQFESNLRAIPYPFTTTSNGTAVEVYHGAHGRYETNAPIRTFTSILIDNEPNVIAAYTCTPLVRFSMSDLSDAAKIQGTTVAELGNRNQPLDMVVYEKDGIEYILMANSSRGMMKISTADIGRDEGITQPVSGGGVAGQTYETIDALNQTVQLDRLNAKFGVALRRNEDGSHDLVTFELP
ncbi:MAG: hypothetical protein R3C03_06780 [Pirellulaceae bacterium]